MKTETIAKVLMVAVAGVGLGAVGAQAQIRTVVVKSDPAPLAGSEFRKFRQPFISDAAGEQVAFRGTSRGSGGGIRGIYRVDDAGAGSLIVQKDEFFLGQKFRNFKRPTINSSGEVAWFAFLGGGKRGVFRSFGTGPPLAVTLSLEPTPVGGVFLDLGSPEITNSGAVVFWALTSVFGTEQGIFRCEGGDGDCFSGSGSGVLDALVTKGTPIPDRPGRFLCTIAQSFGRSDYGISFRSATKTNCNNTGEPFIEGTFRYDFAGVVGVETLALIGEAADVGGGGAVYDRFRDTPAIENDGITAFRASTSGGVGTEAIFFCDPASCPAASAQAVVLKGDFDGDGNELRKFSAPQIADNGDIVFQAKPSGPTAGGPSFYYYRFASGSLERIVTKGDSVPDTPPAVFRRVGSHCLSPGGRLVFRAKIKGAGIPGTTGFFILP